MRVAGYRKGRSGVGTTLSCWDGVAGLSSLDQLEKHLGKCFFLFREAGFSEATSGTITRRRHVSLANWMGFVLSPQLRAIFFKRCQVSKIDLYSHTC